MRRIDELQLQHPFKGAGMLRRAPAQETILVGRRQGGWPRSIGTLMQRMGLAALAPEPGTSKARPGHTIYPYLLPQRTGQARQHGLGAGYHLHSGGAALCI